MGEEVEIERDEKERPVFYVNVGNLSPEEAIAYLDGVRQSFVALSHSSDR